MDTAIEADPLAMAVLDLANQLAPGQEWSGTPTELLNVLKAFKPVELTDRTAAAPQVALAVLSAAHRRL